AGANGVKTMAVRRVHLLVEGAVILPVLSDVGNTRQHTVEGSIKDSALVFGSSLHFDFAQRPIPGRTRLRPRPIEVPCRDLALQVVACLVLADTGDADAYANLSGLVRRRVHHDSEAAASPWSAPPRRLHVGQRLERGNRS